jgi:ribokinase
MANVFNLGSINMDQIVRLPHFPAPGETINGDVLGANLGGKGLNVTVALKRAGCTPVHIGAIGSDDAEMKDALARFEIDLGQIRQSDHPSGTAYVFLDQSGENSIIVCPGANTAIDVAHVEEALSAAQAGDWLTLQNETNAQAEAAKLAKAKGMHIAYMAAPFEAEKIVELTGLIDLLALNETEAAQLEAFAGKPVTELGIEKVLITLGAKGAKLIDQCQEHLIEGRVVNVVDTTAAGDTFFGYFMAEYLRSDDPLRSLSLANVAASLTVQTEGAAVAIPQLADVVTEAVQ